MSFTNKDINHFFKIKISEENLTSGKPEKEISIETKACDFHQWDSLAQINILLDIQKKTKIKVSTSKLNELNSVKSILTHFQ